LGRRGTDVLIRIIDDGSGIPEKVLSRLGERGITTKEGGMGLGIYSSKKLVESWGGKIEVHTKNNSGTTATIILPSAARPSWFVPELKLLKGGTVVILDDDPSVHDAWERKLDENKMRLKLVHLESPEDISRWHKKNTSQRNQAIYLCDYDLKDKDQTGIDVIKALGIEKRSVLVTSYYYKTDIQNVCTDIGIKILPKDLMTAVPIHIASKSLL